MTIAATQLADDSFKTIISASGFGGETNQRLLDASTLIGATASPNLSIANVYYELIGTGNLKLYFDAETDEEALSISGRGNYGLKPSEPKIKQGDTGVDLINSTGDVLVSTDSTLTSYKVVVEFHKEKGFNE